MYYFIIPSVTETSFSKVILCYLELENKDWTYKQSTLGIYEDVAVPDKAHIFEIPDPLDQLMFLAESSQIGLNGVIAYLVNNKVFKAIKTNPICR
jgi:hypothetical protein